jgi:two-component system response regulator HydG
MTRNVVGFAPRVDEQLLRYEWPGNVRELQNAMERCVALARGSLVELEDLPPEIGHAAVSGVGAPGLVRPLHEIEQEYILAALSANDGNQTRTAEQLQIGLATLYRKLKRYRLIDRDGATRKNVRTKSAT